MKLSDQIERAISDHAREYPDGDWQSVNETLSALFYEAEPILLRAGIDPIRGGNEGRAKALRAMGQ